MAVKNLKYRWQRILLIVLLVFAALLLITALLIDRIASPILADKVKSAVLKGSDSLYHINFSNVELHLLQGNVVLYDATLQIDSAVYKQKMQQGLAPNNLYNVSVKRLVLAGIHPLDFYFKKKIDIGRINLTTPQLELSYHLNQKKDTIPKDNRTLYQKISKSIKLIHVGEISLTDVYFKYKDYTGEKLTVSEVKKINFTANDLLIDSASQTDTSRLFYCRDIVTLLTNYSGKSKAGTYTYKLKSVKFSTHTKKINIEGLYITPTLPFSPFFDKSKSDRFAIHIPSIQLNNFDFTSYHKFHTINSSKMTISNGTLDMFSNYKIGPKFNDRIVTFPQYGIKTLKAALNIDTLVLKNIDIAYSQYSKKLGKIGTIVFNKTTGTFLNITNNKDSLKKNNLCNVALTSYFMGQGKFDVHFVFNLTDPEYHHSYKGHLGPMDMTLVNKATMGMSAVQITSGQVKSFDFDIHANKKTSAGRVTLLYNNLKVNVLKTDVGEEYKKKGLISVLANTFIIKHDNPDDGGKPVRSANVVYTRPYNYPFFKTAWLTLLNGIKYCAGAGDGTQPPVKEILEKDKKNLEKQKKKDLERKEEAAEKLKDEKEKAAKALKKQQEKEAKARKKLQEKD